MPRIPALPVDPIYQGEKDPYELGALVKVISPTGQIYAMRNLQGRREQASDQYQISFEFNWNTLPYVQHGWIRIFNLRNDQVKEFPKGEVFRLIIGWLPEKQDTYRLVVESCQAKEWKQHTWEMEIQFSDGGDYLGFFLSRHYPRGTKAADAFMDLYEHYMHPHPINPPYDFHNDIWNLLKPYIEEPFQLPYPDEGAANATSGLGLATLNKIYKKEIAFKLAIFQPKDDQIKFPRGISFFGPFYQAMQYLARETKSNYFIYNRQVHLLDPDKFAPGGGTVLNYGTGLERFQRAVHIPRADTKVQYIKGTHDKAHWLIHALYEGKVGPARQVRVDDGHDVKVNLRAISGRHMRFFDPDSRHAYPLRTEFIGEEVD